MRTETRTVYTLAELAEHHPKGYQRALDRLREMNAQHGGAWDAETCDSLRAVFEAAGIKLRDWRIGSYGRSYVQHDLDENARDLSGPRAMAWLENNLLGALRVPWSGKGRESVRQYGDGYRPGQIKPCPFTGYCTDDDYLDSLRADVARGVSLGDAFENLAGVCQRILESDAEYADSEESLHESAEANGWEFYESGQMV